MKIVLYSTITPGFINEFNINKLIASAPHHEYYIVRVYSQQKKTIFFRKFLSDLKHGKNYFLKDLKTIENSIKLITPKVDLSLINSYNVKAVNDNESESIIKQINPDIILQCGAGIIKKNIFNIPNKGTLNIHHGISPEIRGMNSTFWCLYYGLHEQLGVTCHFIDEGLDTGAVINQYYHKYNKDSNFIDIQKDIITNGAKILIESINKIENINEIIVETKNVDSYYFSKVDRAQYNLLRLKKFQAIESFLKLKKAPKTKSILK